MCVKKLCPRMRMLFDRQGRKQKFPALVFLTRRDVTDQGNSAGWPYLYYRARANYHAFLSKFANVPYVFGGVRAQGYFRIYKVALH